MGRGVTTHLLVLSDYQRQDQYYQSRDAAASDPVKKAKPLGATDVDFTVIDDHVRKGIGGSAGGLGAQGSLKRIVIVEGLTAMEPPAWRGGDGSQIVCFTVIVDPLPPLRVHELR